MLKLVGSIADIGWASWNKDSILARRSYRSHWNCSWSTVNLLWEHISVWINHSKQREDMLYGDKRKGNLWRQASKIIWRLLRVRSWKRGSYVKFLRVSFLHKRLWQKAIKKLCKFTSWGINAIWSTSFQTGSVGTAKFSRTLLHLIKAINHVFSSLWPIECANIFCNFQSKHYPTD